MIVCITVNLSSKSDLNLLLPGNFQWASCWSGCVLILGIGDL